MFRQCALPPRPSGLRPTDLAPAAVPHQPRWRASRTMMGWLNWLRQAWVCRQACRFRACSQPVGDGLGCVDDAAARSVTAAPAAVATRVDAAAAAITIAPTRPTARSRRARRRTAVNTDEPCSRESHGRSLFDRSSANWQIGPANGVDADGRTTGRLDWPPPPGPGTRPRISTASALPMLWRWRFVCYAGAVTVKLVLCPLSVILTVY